ncbi:MAG: hypothetical protein ACP5DX_12235 [Paracoccaceae bacterium]
MNQLKLKIRFSTVATAIDLTPKAFRNWLQRYDLHLLSDHKTRGWTDFTLGDVAVLAITRELVRWGIGVEAANEIAFIVVKDRAGMLLEYRNTPAEAIFAALQGSTLCLHSPDDPDGPYTLPNPEREGYSASDFDSSLWFNPQNIVARAFHRIDAPELSSDQEGE